ncbi:MAG TPA: family 10 glycosylhydrolase [Melioribacteraceae bacterium]|nr:family 10 glycosylhydrolase [Melioribacteraceae bacterium]
MNKIVIVFLVFILFLFNGCKETVIEKEAVRGVWLTNVDSDALNSKNNIIQTVKTCKEQGFNLICVVMYNKGMTLYPSTTMKNLIGQEIDSLFIGRDPLKELIEEAHKENIKVIAWFEFGFSSSYKLGGGKIVAAKPNWASKNNEGNLVTKNGFDWINGFDPEVQQFMLSLIKEVVTNYDIDGIQGDDRLPAMPVEAGYEEYTINKYMEEHNGAKPPKDFRDSAWVNWRANILNNYMGEIYKTVKAIKPKVIVSMAPSIFPWSKEEYLQDWPMWVKQGYVDLVIPQLYRQNIDDYIKILDDIVKTQLTKEELKKFYPGILLKVGSYYPSEQLLKDMIKENRKRDINGEVFFFYEGLKKYPNIFKEQIYSDKVIFPHYLVKEQK